MSGSHLQGAKVFVSGGSGVIGKALVERLHKKGAKIFVGDLQPRPKEWAPEIAYWQGDLNDIDKHIIEDFAPEYFFHLAATFERTMEDYRFFFENYHHNIQLSHRLLDNVKELPSLKKIIFASSYLVYDPQSYLFNVPKKHAEALKEDSHKAPRNLCGMAKLLHECELDFIQRFKEGAIQVVNARIFRSFGRNSRDIISRWIRSLLNHEKIAVYAKEGMFDYIFADDVAEGLLRLAEIDYNGSVNLGSGSARSINEVLNILRQYFPDMKVEEKQSDILYEASQADMSLFQQLTGWHPSHRLEDAIPKIIAFEKHS